MTYDAQHAAIRARLNTQWAGATPIAWPNVDFTPPNNAPWIRLSIQDADAAQVSMGGDTNIHRHKGLVYVMVFVPLSSGDGVALAYADTACGIFRGWQDPSSGVYFRQAPRVVTVGADSDKWYHVNVLAPFERDSFL